MIQKQENKIIETIEIELTIEQLKNRYNIKKMLVEQAQALLDEAQKSLQECESDCKMCEVEIEIDAIKNG